MKSPLKKKGFSPIPFSATGEYLLVTVEDRPSLEEEMEDLLLEGDDPLLPV